MNELFMTYYNSAKENDLKREEKEYLCEYVKTLNENDKEAFYMIIYYYYEMESNKKDIEMFPYNCEKNELRGIDFNLSKLPYKLRQMLHKFCKVVEHKEEDLTVKLTLKKIKTRDK